ncbi:Alpha/Beta hydrolase protein [Pilobolus umbonatus]|nr:Alpha/Beta hydrolase protein [Pilobolus umbonatus]
MIDKNDPASYNHQYTHVNGIRLHYIDENPSSHKPLLLLHGWPDLWLGWREQIQFLSQLGYRVIVPSLRGFGETDAPYDPAEYGMATVSKDLVSLLDYIQVPLVTVIGHDWGGLLSFRFAQFYPSRVKAVTSFCTPYTPPFPQPITLEEVVRILPNFDYQLYLADPRAEKDIDNNVGKFYRRVFRAYEDDISCTFIDPVTNHLAEGMADVPPSAKLHPKVLDYYIKWCTIRGARGGLNWYKQTGNDYKHCKDLDPIFRKPTMMVVAEKDAALPPSMSAKMSKYVPDLEMHTVKNSGHWILWEKPAQCNSLLKDWLDRIHRSHKL